MNLDFVALLASSPEAAKIPLAMFIVFGCAKLLAEVFEKMGQPGIVGEILAGIVIGPSVLNLVQPDDFLTALADLGVMFLLFRVGLEVKASELMRVGASASLVAVLGVVAPFVMGWGILVLWGESQIESVFVGAAMVATSVGITAQVLAAKGLLEQTSSKMILAAAVIDDVLGLLVLALVSSSARGQVHIPELLLTAILAIGFTVIVAKWGTSAMVRLVPQMEAKLRAGEVQFNLAMLLLFGLSLLAIYAGVAAIIGAFLAGMALAESVGHRVHDLAHGVTELLVPFFLAGIGLHMDLSAFTEPGTIVLALIILVAAVFSKLVGCGLGAYRLGRREMLRVGAGMVPRGEVGMVVAQIGLGLGVISQSIYGIVVFMAVATTLIAPAMLNYAYKDLIAARKQAGAPKPPEDFRIG
jgi:Kef-type K+ transport system membrane component KefB